MFMHEEVHSHLNYVLDPPASAEAGIRRENSRPWSRNLLHSFRELLDHLRDLAAASMNSKNDRKITLDGYLTTCALWQILEDFLHRGLLRVELRMKTAAREAVNPVRSARSPRNWIQVLQRGIRSQALLIPSRAADVLAASAVELRMRLRESDLARASEILKSAVERMASEAVASEQCTGSGEQSDAPLQEAAQTVLGQSYPDTLLNRVLKIPACFKDFDCHPDDCGVFANKIAETFEDRHEPLTVLGIRTSGSYLAPLCAAHLRKEGFRDVTIATIRPDVSLLSPEQSRLIGRAQAGTIFIIDDPPFTGDGLLSCIRMLERMGIAANRIIALVFEDPEAPFFSVDEMTGTSTWKELRSRIRTILLPKREWRIRRVTGMLQMGGADMRILKLHGFSVQEAPAGTGDPASAGGGQRFRVRRARRHENLKLDSTLETPGGAASSSFIARGTGFGWFEDHALEIARRIPDFAPPVSRLAEGLHLRSWIEGRTAAENPALCDEQFVRHAARYVAERSRALPLDNEGNRDLEDRKTGWHLLARTFGRSYLMLRSFSYYALRKQLSRICLGAPRAVIDGRMGPAEWIVPAGGGHPLKLDFDEHAFDRSDLSVFDPVIDLAGFSVEHRLPDHLEKTLMIEYISRSGDTGAWERLPTCKMIVCLSAQSELESQAFEGAADPARVTLDLLELERVMSKTANGFLSEAFRLQEARWESDEMVAIDVDGVLEDSILGFSAMSPAAVKAVRTLARHGFQIVLATGRSLPDMIERARILRLRGGIAEYGSVVWDRGRDATATLVTPREMEQLRKLRAILADQDGVSIDPGHEYSVRVFQPAKGSRRRVAAFWLEQILRRWKLDEVRVIKGNSVTDVVGKSVNKGAGLLYLRRIFNAREVHAVGDTHEDVPLFRAADHSYAPASAGPGLAREMRDGDLFVAKGKTQRGLFQIATRIAHGRSRRCPLCAGADQWSEPVSILVQALGLRDRSRFQKMSDLIGHDMLKNFYASL